MTETIAILGRQPALGLAELESLYGADMLRPIGTEAVLIKLDPSELSFDRLGGAVKLAKVLTILESVQWQDIHNFLVKTCPQHVQYLPEGKLQLGISVYGLKVSQKQLTATGLATKKAIKASGRSVRLIPNKTPALNSAQVLHNHLTGPLGWELIFVRDGAKTIVAQTMHEQDIGAYAARDQARPKRDTKVGMLPPKLAQIIINLAQPSDGATILDPFCGTGVILQEALLMGFNAYGTDLDSRMVAFATENIGWLTQGHTDATVTIIEQGDATMHEWQSFSTIATETYLGRPFSSLPKPDALQEVIQDVNTIHKKFLENLARQTRSGFRVSLGIPAWKTPHGFKHLPVLDHLTDMGYTRVSFVHAKNEDLIYYREGQIVARELVTMVRK